MELPIQTEVRRKAASTLTAVELNHRATLHFELVSGDMHRIRLIDTGAEILSTTLYVPGVEERKAMPTYHFWADLEFDGEVRRPEQIVGTQATFYQPRVICDVRIGLGGYDGASAHGGIDINLPRGTPLYAIDLDRRLLCNSLDMGHNNNCWRGFRRWDDGSE